jgi:hypothetical protein
LITSIVEHLRTSYGGNGAARWPNRKKKPKNPAQSNFAPPLFKLPSFCLKSISQESTKKKEIKERGSPELSLTAASLDKQLEDVGDGDYGHWAVCSLVIGNENAVNASSNQQTNGAGQSVVFEDGNGGGPDVDLLLADLGQELENRLLQCGQSWVLDE